MFNPQYELEPEKSQFSSHYNGKIKSIMGYKNYIGWSLDRLANEMGITKDLLIATITNEIYSEEVVTAAYDLLRPLAEAYLKEDQKQLAAREQKLKEDRFPEFSKKVRAVQTKAREQGTDLSMLLGVSKRTFEKWLTGYSAPQGFTRVVLERLYEDYDKNIVLIKQLNPIKET